MTILIILLAAFIGAWLILVVAQQMFLAYHKSRYASYERKLSDAKAAVDDLNLEQAHLKRLIAEFETVTGAVPATTGV